MDSQLMGLDIINPILERVGVNNGYISYEQSSSHKASFEIELGLLDFIMLKSNNDM